MRIDLQGPNGNVNVIMGLVCELLEAQNRTPDQIEAVMADMRSSDYQHALTVANRETYDSFEFVDLDND